MRILLLTQLLIYPADVGPKLKTLQVLRHLASRHEVVYCTFVRNDQEMQDIEKLRGTCHRVSGVLLKRSRLSDGRFLLESLAKGDSFLLRRDDRASMQAMVRQLLDEEHIEAVHVDQLNMMRFVPNEWQGRVILDAHNALWQVVERLCRRTHNPLKLWLLKREVAIIRKYEGQACKRANVVLAVSEVDRRALQEVAGDAVVIKVIPITVDTERLATIKMKRKPQPNRLLSIGAMFWPPNSEGIIWWLKEGYEYLRSLHPDFMYDIVGARPPHALQTLVNQHAGARLQGYVTDAEPFWTSAGTLLVPLLSGGGVRVKILEAMAMGVPVVSTSVGCEGLAVRDNEHILIADTPKELALCCSALLEDRELADRLVQNAYRLVHDRYSAKAALCPLDEIYEQDRNLTWL